MPGTQGQLSGQAVFIAGQKRDTPPIRLSRVPRVRAFKRARAPIGFFQRSFC